MVEVEGEERNKESTEERMVGVDLSKGLILEIQISTGETFARHNLGKVEMSSVLSIKMRVSVMFIVRLVLDRGQEYRPKQSSDEINGGHSMLP